VAQGTIARVGRLAAAVLVSGASLVCGPAVTTTTLSEVDFESSPVLALVLDRTGQPVTPVTPVGTPASETPFVPPTSPDQWFEPSGRNQGTEGIAMFLAAVALRDNSPLYISETIGRTTGGANSDHHVSRTDSWAVDVAVRGIQQPTAQTHLAASRIATALGVPDWPGGDLTKTIGNYRIQVLWLTAGHFNHVHVGVRRMS
jgi:hypothetical protein